MAAQCFRSARPESELSVADEHQRSNTPGVHPAKALPWERHAAMPPTAKVPTPPPKHQFQRFFSDLGPGLITGAADDDPSGISTYSVVGASFGYLPLWTALFTFPLMTGGQLLCARL